MKKTVFFAALLALSAFAETNSIDWRYGKPGVRVVTNAPSVSLFTAEVARVDARIDGIGFADNSHKMNITDGTSTNQTLYSPVVTNKLGFGTAFADALVAGEVAWDPDWMTFRAGVGDGVTGQFFQESHIYAKNVSGQTVTNGMAVRFSGVVGNSGKCEFVLAKAEVGIRPATTLGIATHDIANGALGKITWFGNVNAIDTTGALYGETGWTNNMIVYLSTNTPGFLTRFEPQAPQPRISLGAVINAHKNAGTILVRPTWGMRVTEADDVDGTPLTASGQIMVWDQARGVFDFTDNIGNYISEAEGVSSLKDSQDTNFFQTVENGTGTVWRISTVTNYQVTLSADFLEVAGSSRPAWTNHAWPFSEDGWSGTEEAGNLFLSYPDNSAFWVGTAGTYPSVLIPDDAGIAQGTAVVSQLVSHVTNAVSTYATDVRVDGLESDLSDVVADVAAVALTTNQVNLQPFVKTVYGDFLTTNVVGYTGFLATNGVLAHLVTPSVEVGTSLGKFRYDLCPYTYGTASFSGWAQTASGSGVKNLVFVRMSLFDVAGNLISSNDGSRIEAPTATAYTNVLGHIDIQSPVSNGYLVAEFISATNATLGARVSTGGSLPTTLALNVKPLKYATVSETDAKYPAIVGGTLTNVTLAGTVTIGGVARTDWPESGTPGAITNRQSGVTLGSTSFDAASGDTVFFKKSGVIKARIDSDGSLYVNQFQSTGNYWVMAASGLRVRTDWSLGWSNGNSYVPVDVTLSRLAEGVLQIGTNGTPNNAGSLSLGQIKLGPTISGKQAQIFTDGTNCFFVNVNSVTNAAGGAYPSSNPSNYVTSAVATNISQSLISATCSQTCIRAWMPLTTHFPYGSVDLAAASNSTVVLGPAPLNSFVVRVSVMTAYSAAQYTFSNIVLYAGSHTTPPDSQGFTACTTGVFTASHWNLLSPTGYLMRRDDSKMTYGSFRRDIAAYSLGMDKNVRLLCWWSPATPAELAAGTNVFYYGSDAQ